MTEPIVFRSITIEAFRGFSDPVEIPLNSSVIVLKGPNGTGKTSFFDAIQWLLLGSLERIKRFRSHKNDEHIVNQYRLPGPARVSAEMNLGGRAMRVTRTGRWSESTLELHDGEAVTTGRVAEDTLRSLLSAADGPPLDSSLMASALLQQDVMRGVLEAKPSDRYELLNRMLGLQELGEAETIVTRALQEVAELEKAARVQLSEMETRKLRERDRLDSIDQRVRSSGLVSEATAAFFHTWESTVPFVQPGYRPDVGDVVQIARTARHLNEAIETFARISDEVRRTQKQLESMEPPPTDLELDALRLALADAARSTDGLRIAIERANGEIAAEVRKRDAFDQLVSLAIPLLGSHCPVCEQPIVSGVVKSALEIRSSNSEQLINLRGQLESLESDLRVAAADQTRRAAMLDAALQATAKSDRLAADLLGLAGEIRQAEQNAESLGLTSSALSPEELEGRTAILRDVALSLRELQISMAAEDGGRQALVVRSNLTQLDADIQRQSELASSLARRKLSAESLVSATRAALLNVTESRFRILQPIVDDIYRRLDPHPSFTSFRFKHEIYRNRGTSAPMVRDDMLGTEADPLLVFSTSQANIATLAYFLALGWASGPRAIPFLLLDDPLQSMDDVNVLGFVDLCRYIRRSRQVIISTHEKRFAALMERKLSPRLTDETAIVVEFLAWERGGPQLRVTKLEASDDPARTLFVAS